MLEHSEHAARLMGSLLLFTKYFYKLRTGNEFLIPEPVSRESHVITICKALTETVTGDVTRLMINVPPRHGKTEMLIHYVAWTMAKYPDSKFLYLSYGKQLAAKQTHIIRQIMSFPEYRALFGVEICKDSSAKDNFKTTQGGEVYAAGADGAITGNGAGIQNCLRFGGAIIIDDIHKPKEALSDTIRESIHDWYYNTVYPSRLNSPTRTPIIFLGQRVHEDDLPGRLIKESREGEWKLIKLKALDSRNRVLNPNMFTTDILLDHKKKSPYEFSAQYQQEPQPAGGGLFKEEWFPLLDIEPDFISTFITADTAETTKEYNDATVFSFWGVYKIIYEGIETGEYGLHWIRCHECRVEPKDLKSEFMSFYSLCMRNDVKPKLAAIEKKSTGVTLLSTLRSLQGIQILDIERNRNSGSKSDRFLSIQPFIASKLISLPSHARHTKMCVEHMGKITANDSHRFDDIADTCVDAVHLALIDKIINIDHNVNKTDPGLLRAYSNHISKMDQLRISSWD